MVIVAKLALQTVGRSEFVDEPSLGRARHAQHTPLTVGDRQQKASIVVRE